MFFCAISGEPPQEPVVVAKSGKVYEKRLILKYINENGTDPISGDKLEESDLIVIKASPEAAAPRPPTHTSIPAMLQSLQNESLAILCTNRMPLHASWRDLFENATRLERLSQMCKQPWVLHRLQRQLEKTSKWLRVKPNETHQSLSAARKKRKPPVGYSTPADVKTYTAKHTIPSLHSSSPPGITCIAVSQSQPSQFLTGGNDKIVQLYDRDTDKVLETLKGHTKRVNHVAFRERDGLPSLLISAGADKIAKIWSHDSASGGYIPKSTIRTHKGDLTGLVVHPTSTLIGLSSLDKTYSLHDLTNFAQVFRSAPSDEAFTSLAIHPDGMLVALGTPTSTIQIYDIRDGSIAATLTPTESSPFTVNTLSFSENGYHLCAPDSLSSAAIWDLRKQKATASIPLGDGFKINRIRYDPSAQFFGIAGSEGLRILAHKTWEELVKFEEAGDVADLAFGENGKEVWGVSGREVRIWGLPAE
ncbi:Pre-mRNA-processing factor 19 [Pleurotus pulmonarius]